MANWPDTLPPSPLIDGFEEEEPDVVLRTNMDAGPAKTRRRYTSGVSNLSWPTLLTTAQRATLINFYRVSCDYGAIPYNVTHPITGDIVSVRFVKPPKFQAASHSLFRATLNLEIMP